ncbi:hypothetical protein [Paraburkholderia fungorum]|uniref:Uncharacterized protein n=1 Tax=Paraburkholderia fungorum TaxID=134537 RepID=A0A3R7E0M4_9BURK|nr:hypothetical protein [Paraburkholderia fungorum]RKF31440.1 hypothetical protein BCY88_11725 [Paraburkholderia fungorum]
MRGVPAGADVTPAGTAYAVKRRLYGAGERASHRLRLLRVTSAAVTPLSVSSAYRQIEVSA